MLLEVAALTAVGLPVVVASVHLLAAALAAVAPLKTKASVPPFLE